jgi:hypothetical protein
MSETNSQQMADNTEKTEFDLNLLQSRINQIKEEGKEDSEFTRQFIECLMVRHDLSDCLPEDFEIEGVPDTVLESITEGNVPTIDQLNLLNEDDKNWLLIQLVWVCGLAAVSTYCAEEEVEEEDENTFGAVLSMMDVSEAHHAGCYLVCALTLLMGKIPHLEMIEAMTNDFDNDPMMVERSREIFYQLSSGILSRYLEDLQYYNTDD